MIAFHAPTAPTRRAAVPARIPAGTALLLGLAACGEPVGERRGHIPGARHVDSAANLEDDGGVCGLKSVAGLSALYADLDPAHLVMTYCNSGNRATVSYLALRTLGRYVAVYDGSWREWSASPDLSVEVGEEAGP